MIIFKSVEGLVILNEGFNSFEELLSFHLGTGEGLSRSCCNDSTGGHCRRWMD